MLPLAAALAFSAEVTEIPPALRADISIGYAGDFGSGSLAEAGTEWGRTKYRQQDVNVRAEFAPVEGLSASIALPVTASWSRTWVAPWKMTYDPATETGTYTQGVELPSIPELKGSGLQGIWFGVALAPFSEKYSLGQQVTWRLDAAFRPGSGSSRWTAVDGKRGAANGGTGWKFSGAFSADRESAEPWMTVVADLEGPVTVDVADESGTIYMSAAELHPASTFDVAAGVQIYGSRDDELDTAFAVDLHAGFGYVGYSDVPSGQYLPSVLDASRSIVVTQGDHLRGSAGIGVIIDPIEYFGIEFGADGVYSTPYRLEHVYAVTTGIDTLDILVHAGIEGRVR